MNVSFGTRIILQDRHKQIDEVNNKFQTLAQRKKINVPMEDSWVEIERLPRTRDDSSKNKSYKVTKKEVFKQKEPEFSPKPYPVYGTTKGIDICSGGIVMGNNGNIAMFHIAPTMENHDFLFNIANWGKDYMGNSIDKFEKSSGGIKSAIIVGGKNTNSSRGELSKTTNELIREKFIKRNIPISTLSDLKFYECDLFYSSADDTLKIGVDSKEKELRNIFGEVNLLEKDSIEIRN